MKVFSSWSGGKESALATYKAISQGHEVMYLLNFISEDGQRSRSHGTKASVLALQAEATGIPIIQVKTSWEDYEENFKKTVREMKSQGIEGGVFGDMEVEEHREWVERVCSEVGIKAFLPLWGTRPEELIEEFLKLRFKAIIVATRLDETFLGKALDKALLEQIKRVGSHPCGENGEYHTFVTEAPIFRKSFKVTGGELKKKDSMWFWDISANMIAQDSPSCRCEEHSDETVPLDSSPTQEERVPRGVYPEQR